MSDARKEADELVSRGLDMYRRGRRAAAKSLWNAAIRLVPGHPVALKFLDGKIQDEQGASTPAGIEFNDDVTQQINVDVLEEKLAESWIHESDEEERGGERVARDRNTQPISIAELEDKIAESRVGALQENPDRAFRTGSNIHETLHNALGDDNEEREPSMQLIELPLIESELEAEEESRPAKREAPAKPGKEAKPGREATPRAKAGKSERDARSSDESIDVDLEDL